MLRRKLTRTTSSVATIYTTHTGTQSRYFKEGSGNEKEIKGEEKPSEGVNTVRNKAGVKRRPQVKVDYEDKPGVAECKKSKWEPTHWQQLWTNIIEMRKHRNAPVDTMGCDVISDIKAEPQVYRYQVLLSLLLSSQTKDQVTSAAMTKLQQHGCNIPNILATSDKKLGELIYPVGFWKRKVHYIKKTSAILRDQYQSDIPQSIEELCELPGIGPKMAYLTMRSAWRKVVGIGVDVHVHRISNRLGWVKKPTKEPEQTRKALEDWLPRPKWDEINHLLVGFGQQTCLPVAPKCSECLNKNICPFGRSTHKTKVR